MGFAIQIVLNEKLYLRDPEQTDLGRKIVDTTIQLIDELGFEKFTFKKLAIAIQSTEASIYRYFENKHKLLLYLVSWYWSWVEYVIEYETHNLEDPRERLNRALFALANSGKRDPNFSHIDETALHRIVVAESSKAYLTKDVDGENQEGLFQGYKSLSAKLVSMVEEINPDYPYPAALVSTVLEASRKQIFFAQHLPSLTEIRVEGEDYTPVAEYLTSLVFCILGK